MADPVFGLSITSISEEARPASVGDMSVIGLVGTAPLADATAFPLNTPVLMFSDDAEMLAKLGSTGTLADAVSGVNDQLGDFQVSAKMVIVRVTEGVSEAATITNLIGSSSAKTGIWALPEAGPELGVIPRLIGVPGYTSQQESGLATLNLLTGGSAMTVAPTISFTGGGSDPGKVLPTAEAVLGTGVDSDKVVALNILTPGSLLSGAITVVFSGGGVAGGKVLPTASGTIDKLANAVVAALPPVLSRLLGVAVCDGGVDSLTNYTDWRETISSQRIIPLASSAKVGNPAVIKNAVGRVLGIAVRRDHEKNGRPFHSWANQPVYGIVGPNRKIQFSLTDGATEAQSILGLNGGVILRGEAGVETAIASGGFVFVGTDTCSEDILWTFYNQVRGRDYIHLAFLKTLRFYLGRYNLTLHAIESVLSTMKLFLRDLQADGDILGFKVGFSRDQNSPEQLRLGKFVVDFAAEEPAPLRYIGIRSMRYRPALDALLEDLVAQIDAAV
jgi:uncharacterized protein